MLFDGKHKPGKVPVGTKVAHGPIDRGGFKSDFWDGGHPVPFLVRWPGKVEAASQSAQLVCLTDLYATFTEITGVHYPASEGVDFISFLSTLLGKDNDQFRQDVIHHSYSGLFAIRKGQCDLLPGPCRC